MAAKPQRSVRFDNEAYDGVLRVRQPDENFTAAVNRVLLVGIKAIEGESQTKYGESQNEAQAGHGATQTKYSDGLQLYIKRLEDENARLIAEHEADRAAIAGKDAEIAEALHRAHDLAEQSNYVALSAHESKRIPATTTGGEITVITGEEVTEETADEEPAKSEEQPVEEKPVEEQEERRGWFSRLFW